MTNYNGHYSYHPDHISSFAPECHGVYYCGYLEPSSNSLIPLYIGRAAGLGVSIRSRLRDHFRSDFWRNVTHFGFVMCTTPNEAIQLEAQEILRLQPAYNTTGKGW